MSIHEELDTAVKLTVYRHFAESGTSPALEAVASEVEAEPGVVRSAFARLRAARVLFLEGDGDTIRMAPPFSAVETQHFVESGGVIYFANCAWDALGIPAALRQEATVRSRCEQTREPLRLAVGLDGPGVSDWLFHCLVPAAHWWDDLVFT